MPFSDSSSPPMFAEVIRLVNVRLAEAQEDHTQARMRLSRAQERSQNERRTAEDAQNETLLAVILLNDPKFRAELTILDGYWQSFRRGYPTVTTDGFEEAVVAVPEDTKELRAIWVTIQRTIAAKVKAFNERTLP